MKGDQTQRSNQFGGPGMNSMGAMNMAPNNFNPSSPGNPMVMPQNMNAFGNVNPINMGLMGMQQNQQQRQNNPFGNIGIVPPSMYSGYST